MSVQVRALLAALIVAVVALTGALYLGYRAGVDADAAQNADSPLSRLAALDPKMLGEPTDQHLVSLAYQQVERVYYKPVESATLLKGERNGILALLKVRHINGTALPAGTTAGDAVDSGALTRVLSYAESHYGTRVGSDGQSQITQAALRGMMSALGDPYTVYLAPQEIRQLNESLDGGNFGGIGVFIYELKSGDIIVQPIEGLPAARAGMGDDIIDTVNGVPVKGIALDKVERMIRGDAGTTVTITAHPYKKSGKHTFRIAREIIHVPTVKAKVENNIEYVRLSDFGSTSADEVRKAFLDGKAHNVKGYILDLRDNGGGLLDAAVNISSIFIPQGTIVSTIDRQGVKFDQDAKGTAVSGLRPLVVLVNKYTASASEITSGAIKDYKLGLLVGTKTFGKGVVQSIYPMPDDGALKITTARYVTPLGRDIHHKGIQPDVVVDQDPDPALIDTPRDKQLAVAKARLASMTR
ncbi:MAG: S41 family peptidase [Candidatus Eremiobacteraeota bacterium]|nr:S41 family peptidase [Candidatus Eremiobacteraeota bacterium]